MKFITSLLLISSSIYANPVDLTHESQWELTQNLKNILTKTYKIPESMIGIRTVDKCELVVSKGKLNLCIKKNGDLLTVSVDQRFIRESLKIFKAPKQEQR